MKKSIFFTHVLILVMAGTMAAWGQYSGNWANVAPFKAAQASDSIDGFGPTRAVDTLLTTSWSTSGDAPVWLEIDLGGYYHVNGFGLVLSNTYELPTALTFQLSEDGSTWIDQATVSISEGGTLGYDIIWGNPVQKARFYITAKDAISSIAQVMVFARKLEIPGAPIAMPATDVSISGFTANWLERNRAEGYILQVARDEAFIDRVSGYANKDMADALFEVITGLEENTTYYYRLRAYNVSGTSAYSNVIELNTSKLSQTISFDPIAAKIYGDAAFELSATATSGLPVNFISEGDSVATIDGTTLSIVGVGSAQISANQSGDEMYNAATPVFHTLVVTAKELTVNGITVSEKTYDGQTLAFLSGASLVGAVDGDDVMLVDADQGEYAQADAGSDIAVSTAMFLGGSDSLNYTLVQPTGITGNILKKELTVTADDASREACADNPSFTLQISGYVGDEDEGVLTTLPTATSDAGIDSPAGDYDIVPSGGEATNYSFVYVNGTLTVGPDVTPPTLSVHSHEIELDETGMASITADDLITLAEDNCGIVETTLSQESFTTDDIGTVAVEVTVKDAAGNSTSANASVTVTGPDGINDYLNSGIKAYPNPTSGIVEMEFEMPAQSLKVMDMTGKTIFERSNLQDTETFDLTEYSDGIYVFQFRYGQELRHMKVIKK